jgi:hypothetical protein
MRKRYDARQPEQILLTKSERQTKLDESTLVRQGRTTMMQRRWQTKNIKWKRKKRVQQQVLKKKEERQETAVKRKAIRNDKAWEKAVLVE